MLALCALPVDTSAGVSLLGQDGELGHLSWNTFVLISGSLEDKQFQPKETLVFIRLVKYALQALDIYTLQVAAPGHAQTRNAA